MIKHELLSPAGNMESLLQAIHNGADAVYLGIKNFGARRFAKNFTDEELLTAIKLCHLYGVRLYVTMNTLIKDNEVNTFLERVEYLHKSGVDALIMQDFGMISLVRKMYPNLEIHASTQANNSSYDTVKMFYEMGVKRVVLSREMTIDEIEAIDLPIEKEVFIHGALCISYSGNCLMSSMIGKRSGNRGECAGSCRLKYDLLDNDKVIVKDKYLLSTKELNTSSNFDKLLKSSITSFKIEGRMKSPEYVGFITKFYRSLIDHKQFNLEEETKKLKTLFNRDFTTGNLFNTKNIMNTETPNHIGIEIGKVIEVNDKQIKIKLTDTINQEDGIRFLESKKGLIVNYLCDKKNNLINSSNDIVYIDNKIELKTCDRVFKTIDKKLVDSLKKYDLRKIPISIKLTAKLGDNLLLEISDNKNIVSMTGNIVEQAKTSPSTKENITSQLEKLGTTPFISKKTIIDIDDNIFIPVKELNELRRNLTTKLIDIRENNHSEFIKEKVSFDNIEVQTESGLTATCHTKEQVDTCLELGFKRIYLRDKDVYKKYTDNNKVVYFLERNQFHIEDNLENKTIVSEYFNMKNKSNLYGNYFLNVYNSYTAYFLLQYLNNICLSKELSLDESKNLIHSFKSNFNKDITPEILVYGRIENMMIRGNILNITSELNRFSLLDKQNRLFPVYLKNNNTYILNYQNFNDIIHEKYFVKRFDFYNETKQEIINIVNKLK